MIEPTACRRCDHDLTDGSCPSCERIRLSERRAVLLRVAGELRETARRWASESGVKSVLNGHADQYEREAAEVK